jgi:hypothetical protein
MKKRDVGVEENSGGGTAFQCGQQFDGFAEFLLRASQIVQGLQVQPELGACAEEVSEPQCGVTGNRASAIQDLRNPVGGDAEFARQFGGTHVECLELFCEMFAGMDRANSIAFVARTDHHTAKIAREYALRQA